MAIGRYGAVRATAIAGLLTAGWVVSAFAQVDGQAPTKPVTSAPVTLQGKDAAQDSSQPPSKPAAPAPVTPSQAKKPTQDKGASDKGTSDKGAPKAPTAEEELQAAINNAGNDRAAVVR